MKNFYEKIKAFTLAEVAIVLVILGIIAGVTIAIGKAQYNYYANRFSSDNSFENIQAAIEALHTERCSTSDLNSGICYSSTSLPVFGHNGSRGLCDRLIDVFNVVGKPDCTLRTTSDFKNATPNFITTNGMKFFNFGSDASGDPLVYTVYVDIDGSKRNGILNQDVMRYKIYAGDSGKFTIFYNDTNVRSGLSVGAYPTLQDRFCGSAWFWHPSPSWDFDSIKSHFRTDVLDIVKTTVGNNLKTTINSGIGGDVGNLDSKINDALSYAYNQTYNRFLYGLENDGASMIQGSPSLIYGGNDGSGNTVGKNRVNYYYCLGGGGTNCYTYAYSNVDSDQVIKTFLNYFDRYCATNYGGTYTSKTTSDPTTTRGGTGGTGTATAVIHGSDVKVEKY